MNRSLNNQFASVETKKRKDKRYCIIPACSLINSQIKNWGKIQVLIKVFLDGATITSKIEKKIKLNIFKNAHGD